MQGGPRSLQLIKGPRHELLHGRMSLALTRQVRANRGLTEALAVKYAERLDGPVEFCKTFAEEFPTAVITAVLGLSWFRDQERLQIARRCTARLGLAATTLDYEGPVYADGIAAARQLTEILRPDVRVMIDRTDENIVAQIHQAGRAIFDDWGLDDTLVQCRLLYFAGSNSSAHFLANIVYVLATIGEVWEQLEKDRSLIPTFLEEILRVVPPVQTRPRVAVGDTSLHGFDIAAGDVVYLHNAAANRDPQRYTCPAELDLEQKPRRHLAFNAGPRVCPGAPTARMEGRAVVAALLDRFERVSLDETQPAPEFVGGFNMGYMPLHLICQLRRGR
jgi:cytochrome P450